MNKAIERDLSIRSENIQRIYGYYINHKFLVNRRYQRKLVWSLEEKRAFIDSIEKGFPVPLILLAELINDGIQVYEIIDGMQRLNAIMGFIDGEFDLNGYYFNLETMAETKLLADKGILDQKEPKLSREVCTIIVGYVIPLSI